MKEGGIFVHREMQLFFVSNEGKGRAAGAPGRRRGGEGGTGAMRGLCGGIEQCKSPEGFEGSDFVFRACS